MRCARCKREPESDVRARLATLLKSDFSREIAELLGLESLADRDEAWRSLSHRPPAPESSTIDLPELTEQPQTSSTTPGLLTGRELTRSLPPTAGPTPVQLRRSGSMPPPSGSGVAAVPLTMATGRTTGRIPPLPPPTSAKPIAVPAQLPGASSNASAHLVWAVVALAALALIAWLAHPLIEAVRPRVQPPQIRVVAASTPQQPASTPEVAPIEQPSGTQAADTSAPRSKPDKEPRDPESSAKRLSRAFRQQQDKIEVCFRQHASAMQELPVVQLEFDLSASGKLTAARVAPAALAGTALGQCLQEVAMATQFPAQGKAISFAIPLSATTRAN